ncbi:TonB-dependent receptor [Thalassotalea agariperforans]
MPNHKFKKPFPCFKRTVLSSIIVMNIMGVNAQEVEQKTADDADNVEVITVSGIRESYRSAINNKRGAANIVDSISLKDIGALPDNSVAETLERITGVSADRFKGNASEISIRGLGPFLGMSTINGRAISSGSGNRSVAFSQFPSELVNGVTVYKSQSANLLEGGVSGTIDLGTIRPVDYGKERFQAEIKGLYNEYQAKFDDHDGLGHKKSFSYVNSFDVSEAEFGFAVGYAGGKTSRPEDTYLTSSTLRPCNSDYALDGGSNCSFDDDNAAAVNGSKIDGDYYFIPNLQSFRQLESIEDNDAAIVALQWKTDTIDINVDGQWSERYYFEDRHDLSFDDGRRRITNWLTDENHVLQSYTGNSRLGISNEFRDRNEEYKGLGLNVKWQANEDLALIFDAAYSGTNRWQNQTRARFRSDRVWFDWKQGTTSQFPDITNVYTDLDDPTGSAVDWREEVKDLAFFDADSEARKYRFDIDDRIRSAKLDAVYLLDKGIFTYLNTGIAYSERSHQNYAEESITARSASADVDANLAATLANCSSDFRQKDYGDDANSPVSEWAYIDTFCAHNVITEGEVLMPDPKAPSENDINMVEEVTSFYVMSDFETQVSGMYLSGNVGLRYVETDITSHGVSQGYTVTTDEAGFVDLNAKGEIDTYTLTNSFSNLLPSINMTLELLDDVELRLAAYKAVSRPDMWFYGAGRDVKDFNDGEYRTVEAALSDGNVASSGNPYLELLESNNYELGVNWYFAEESMFSLALYSKSFAARMGSENNVEDVIIDGQAYEAEVIGTPTIFDDKSDINGLELTLTHQFSSLPAPFDGLGISASYNYADSDYKTPEAGGSIPAEVSANVTPGNLPGLSEHVANSQVYWEGDNASVRLSYKYRSDYLKPFGANFGQTNRFVEDQKSLDLSLGYKFTKNLSIKAQMLNLTNEPAVQYRVAPGAFNQIEYSGPKVFLGLKYRM